MKEKLAPFVESRITKGKATSYYFIPPRKLVQAGLVKCEALGKDPEKAKQRAIVLNQALEAVLQGAANKPERDTSRKVVSDLINRYFQDTRFTKLSGNSQRSYKGLLKLAILVEISPGMPFGEIPLDELRAEHADLFLPAFIRKHSLISAIHCCRTLRRIFAIGFRWGWVTLNPFYGLELPGVPERTVVWQPEHIEAFVKQANADGLDSIGWIMKLAYATAQRPSDILGLTHENIYTHSGSVFLRLVQKKTGEEVNVPIPDDDLKGYLTGRIGTLFPHPLGGEYNYFTFNRHFRQTRKAAGIPEGLQFRDVRRTVATELGDAGATEAELMSVGGWRSPKVVRRYLRPTNVQATNAINKLMDRRKK